MKKLISLFILVHFMVNCLYALTGDYRTRAGVTGNWNGTAVWQQDQGSWVNVSTYPTSADGTITILAGCNITITANVTIDEVDVKGILTINSGVTVTVDDGSGYDIDVDNTSTVQANLYVYGTIHCHGRVYRNVGDGNIYFYSGSTYQHDVNGGYMPVANSWDANSTVEVTGITSDTGGPVNFDQTYGHLTWNCTGQTAIMNLTNIPTVNGNFTLNSTGSGILALSVSVNLYMSIPGNYTQTGGTFYPSNGSADDILYIGGNFNMSGGTLGGPPSGNGSTTLIFNKNGVQTYTYTAGQGSVTNKLHFQVNANSILDVGSSIVGDPLYTTGNFTLYSGAGLKTANSSGITSSGASGSVQVFGSRYYDSNANYTYYFSGAQTTGSGFPTSPTGTVTIGSSSNTTNLTFSSLTTINGTLVIVNGTVVNTNVSYASGGTLEYQGTSGQTMGNNEWPSNTVPKLKINNSSGVAMNTGKTVSTTLYLTSGALSIGSGNTLTLNGTISQTSGTLTGSADHQSNITFGGSGSTSLPAVLNGLNNLTINRSGATISLTGSVTIYGTMTMTAGTFSLSGGTLSYSGGTLKYNGSGSAQTTASAEFPSSSGPTNLYIDNSSGVNLNFSRTLNGTLTLNNGAFSIGSNTITLNQDIVKNSGSLTGGSSSNITFGEYTSSTSLPGVTNGLNNLTINRSTGILLSGNNTVSGTLSLSSGTFYLSGYTLTVNGTISQTSGNIQGGTTSCIIFGGSGSSTSLPSVTNGLTDLTINRSAGISLSGSNTVSGILYLTSGALSLGSNTLTLNGAVNVTGGSLTGGGSSDIIFGGSGASTSLPAVTLNNLTINRSSGISMGGNVTTGGTLILTDGLFQIGSNTLTINGSVSGALSNLTGGTGSSITVGGSGSSLTLPAITLYDLSLNRANGLILGGDIEINNNMTMTNGSITLNGFSLSYNASTTLIYNGSAPQTTSDNEFPAASGPKNLTIMNGSGVSLHDSRTITGTLTLSSGSFSIGGNTLTLYGAITTGFGYLTGGATSNLTIANLTGPALNLPSVTLNDLTINRSNIVSMTGNVTIKGILGLTAGTFSIGSNTLTIEGVISTGSGNLSGGSSSNITFQGSGAATSLPAVVLSNLIIDRVNGVNLAGDVTLHNDLGLQSGQLGIGSNTMFINGSITCTAGSLLGGISSNIVIGGTSGSTVLPAVTLNNLQLEREEGINLGGDVDVQGTVLLTNGLLNVSVSKLTIHSPLAGNPANLSTTSSSNIEISGTGGGMNIGPEENIRITSINNLTISNTYLSGIDLNGSLVLNGQLNIANNCRLNVKPGKSLTADGNTSLDGTESLIVKSELSGTGSFKDNGTIYYGSSASAKAERYLTGNKFHMISLPISNTIFGGTDPGETGDVFLHCTLDWYNESTNSWVGMTGSSDVVPGKGYITKYVYGGGAPDHKTLNYEGYFGTGLKNFTITNNSQGYNLVSNPYPSSVSWDALIGWSRSDLVLNSGGYDIWIWNPNPGVNNWGTYNSGTHIGTNDVNAHIPVGQAFFVQAANNGTLSCANDVREHSDHAFLKDTPLQSNILRIKVSNGISSDQAVVYFDTVNNMNSGTAKWFSMDAEAPDLYTVKNSQNYSVNILPFLNGNVTVPLYFTAGVNGTYEISNEFIESFDPSVNIFLEDIQTNSWTDLREDTIYFFTASTSDNAGRFLLHFNPATTGSSEYTANQPFIYVCCNEVFIFNPSDSRLNVQLISTSGQTVSETKVHGKQRLRFSGSFSSGIYLVKYTGNDYSGCKKVIFNRSK